MRARNLKPGFFKNEDLLELPPLTRILFEGLWCMADREGRLEDRPKRIKIEVLPADDYDVDAALQSLHERGLIERYDAGGERCIQVTHFLKHQNPHVKEVPSTIPAPCKHQSSTILAPDQHHTSPAESPLLNPESGIPFPESPSRNPEGVTGGGNNARAEDANPFGEPTAPPAETIEGYLTNIIGTLGGGCTDEFRGYQEVIDDDAIRLAIDDADALKARTWGYIRTILRRWVSSGIRTAADARDDLARFRAAKDAKARAAPITYDPSKILNTPDRYAKRPDDFGDEFMRRLEEKERAKARPGPDDAGDHRD